MEIFLANTDEQIKNCYAVMQELRPHIPYRSFVDRVKEQEKYGYLLAYVPVNELPVAVAGFHIGMSLAWGRYLYVDDLVALPEHRSHGYGARLLSWLKEYAIEQGCEQIHLDSALNRKDAHRFYVREELQGVSMHFMAKLEPHHHP